jgi:hypothetical protein
MQVLGSTQSSLLRQTRVRFWIEAGLGVASAFLLILTLVLPDWIEVILRFSPDRHNGSVEWAIDGACLFVALVAGVLARIEWRRLSHDLRLQPAASSRHLR